MPRKLSDIELGRRERERRKQIVGVRLGPIAVEVIRRAEEAGVSRSMFIRRIVEQALGQEAES